VTSTLDELIDTSINTHNNIKGGGNMGRGSKPPKRKNFAYPTSVLITDKSIVSVPFDYSTHNLYDIIPGVCMTGTYNYNLEGVSVPLLCQPIFESNLTLLYLSNTYDFRCLNEPHNLRLSRIQFGPNLFSYGYVSRVDILRYALYLTHAGDRRANYTYRPNSIVKKWCTGESSPPISRVSSAHLRHVSIYEVRKLGLDFFITGGRSWILQLINTLSGLGMQEALFVGLLTWVASLPDNIATLIAQSSIWTWKFDSIEQFAKRIKDDFSLRLKALQNNVDVDLTPFFEFEVLVNRGLGAVDWVQERENRTKPNLCNINGAEIYSRAVLLFQQIRDRGAKPKKTTWEDYWAMRWAWSPTGAYHSQYEEDKEYIASDRSLKHKFYSFNRMPAYPFTKFSRRRAEMVAWSSTKYEWGKQRAIYGVDATSFIMAGYCMPNIEEMLSEKFPIGQSANEENVAKTVQQVLANGTPFCFDFEDFNSQHSNSSMQAVLRAYHSVFNNDMVPDQITALGWVIRSLDECYINDVANNTKYKTSGTLLSGWRFTTVMNTILNQIYTDVCLDGLNVVSTHNGDDVLMSVKNMKQIVTLEQRAKLYNIRFQKTKCFLGAIAEFLRVDHKAKTSSQYLARAVATFVHGPTESALPNNLRAYLKSQIDRAYEILERGGDKRTIENILYTQLQHTADIWDTDYRTLYIIATTHSSLGGLSETISEKSLSHEIVVEEKQTSISERIEDDKSKSFPGVRAYAEKLCRSLIDRSFLPKLVKSLRAAVFSTTTNQRCGAYYISRIPTHRDFVRARMAGMYRSNTNTSKVLLAKAYGVPLVAINMADDWLTIRLREEKDPSTAALVML